MSIAQVSSIDAIGIDLSSNAIHLTISDHLTWDREHLLLLQEKLNSYLAFIENGELLSTYPAAADRSIVIDAVLKYRPTAEALGFLERAATIIAGAGFTLRYAPGVHGYQDDSA